MKRAYVGLRAEPFYRREAFMSGLRACGYDARLGPPQTFDGNTVYCCWNRYQPQHDLCTKVEKAGGTVLIAENGYLGPGGVSPHGMNPREIYALARSGHNGSGTYYVGGPERWQALGVELQPWREDGKYILVAPNRPFGRPDTMMPLDWVRKIQRRLGEITKREVRVRPHPGDHAPKRPLEDDLRDAWAVVIWASSVGVQALIRGIPVICDAPAWICKQATFSMYPSEFDEIDARCTTYMDRCRLNAMHALAWAQWHVEEIASGEPFRHLLEQQSVAA